MMISPKARQIMAKYNNIYSKAHGIRPEIRCMKFIKNISGRTRKRIFRLGYVKKLRNKLKQRVQE